MQSIKRILSSQDRRGGLEGSVHSSHPHVQAATWEQETQPHKARRGPEWAGKDTPGPQRQPSSLNHSPRV